MSDQWHLLQEGQQYGPYSGDQLVEFAKEGRIVRESMVWAEGMADWVAASQVEGLFPPAPVAVPAAVAPTWAPPGAVQPAWMRGGNPAARVQPGRVAPVRGHPSPLLGRQVAEVGGNYPPVEAKGASFGLLAGMLGGGFALLLIVLILFISGLKSESLQGPQLTLLVVLMILGGIGIVVAAVLQYVYLARVWSYLQYGNPRTTPGKAVGFLFVPLFNMYWLFVAFYGLAQDWNRITSQYVDLQRAPKMGEGVFLTFCIGCFVAPLGLVMWFVVMSQICQAINFMAYRPVHHHGMIQFG